MFAFVEQNENLDISLGAASPSHMTFLHASFRMTGLDYYRSTLSVAVHPKIRVKDVNTLLLGVIAAGFPVHDNGLTVLSRDRPQCLQTM